MIILLILGILQNSTNWWD